LWSLTSRNSPFLFLFLFLTNEKNCCDRSNCSCVSLPRESDKRRIVFISSRRTRRSPNDARKRHDGRRQLSKRSAKSSNNTQYPQPIGFQLHHFGKVKLWRREEKNEKRKNQRRSKKETRRRNKEQTQQRQLRHERKKKKTKKKTKQKQKKTKKKKQKKTKKKQKKTKKKKQKKTKKKQKKTKKKQEENKEETKQETKQETRRNKQETKQETNKTTNKKPNKKQTRFLYLITMCDISTIQSPMLKFRIQRIRHNQRNCVVYKH
jgi:DNA polymerase III gamma/tau subunit